MEVCTGHVGWLWFKFILLTLPLLDNYLPGSLAFWVVANKRFDFTYIRNKGNKIIIPWIDNCAVTPSNIGCFFISGRRHCYYIQLQTDTEITRKKMSKFLKRKMKQRNFFVNMKQQMFSPDSRAYTYLIVQGPIRENRKGNLFWHVVYSQTTAPEHYSAWSKKTLGNRDFKIAQPQKSGRF